jgi:hypothetical protein
MRAPVIRGVKLLAWMWNFGVEEEQETEGFEPGARLELL